ncbi:RHS repeat domain-containing protein, partial [Sedimenticola hydrogenitrophicus]|uniref:RHS repeat domain-containing protein n=1 Tax=Sedimenticola hydrogenitrophicus TaxID=2967975 RepID=UPI0021A7C72A
HTYDVFGRRIQVSNALGQGVDMTYDQRDRLVEASDALGRTTDQWGQTRSILDQNARRNLGTQYLSQPSLEFWGVPLSRPDVRKHLAGYF